MADKLGGMLHLSPAVRNKILMEGAAVTDPTTVRM